MKYPAIDGIWCQLCVYKSLRGSRVVKWVHVFFVDGIAFYFLARSWWTDPCPYCADTVDAKNVYISLFQINPEVDGKRRVQYVGSQSTNTCWTSAYPSAQSFPNWMWNAQTLAARGSVSMVLKPETSRDLLIPPSGMPQWLSWIAFARFTWASLGDLPSRESTLQVLHCWGGGVWMKVKVSVSPFFFSLIVKCNCTCYSSKDNHRLYWFCIVFFCFVFPFT